MSYWERLLSPSPETTPWPQALPNAKTTSRYYSAGAGRGAGGGTLARLPSAPLHRQTRTSGASSSTGNLALKTRPWSEHNNNVTSSWPATNNNNNGQLSASPPITPQGSITSGEIDPTSSGEIGPSSQLSGYWVDRRKRASLATADGIERRKRASSISYESLVLDSRKSGSDYNVVSDDDSSSVREGGMRSIHNAEEEWAQTNSGGHGGGGSGGGGGASRSRGAAATRGDKHRRGGSLR